MSARCSVSPSAGPKLRLAATLWSLSEYPTKKREWSLARKVAAIKAAGFEGVQAPYRPELRPLLEQRGLAYVGAFDATTPGDFPRQIREMISGRAVVANAQIGENDTPTREAVRLAVAVLAEARCQGLLLSIETHRDTATETPEKFFAIAAGYRRATGKPLPVTWDHSHFALVKHLKPKDFVPRLLDAPECVQRARFIHCRPFNGQHCQVPVTNASGRLTPEFRDWLVFVRAWLAQWLQGASVDDELWVVPEIGGGPNGYHLSIFNPPWTDAVRCAQELRRVWVELDPALRRSR